MDEDFHGQVVPFWTRITTSELTSYTGPEGTVTFGYDLTSELTSASGARTENYGYDLNGNRNTAGYSTGSGNRLLGDGTFTYLYDSEGNLLEKTRQSDGQKTNLTWDHRNRLTQVVVKTSAGVTVTNDVMTYDIEDRRIGKSVNGTQNWFFYDDANPYLDFNSGGSVTERYLSAEEVDAFFARYDVTTTGWYLKDLIGSVREIVKTDGTVLDQITYDSYGKILSETNPSNGDRFKFTGREWDSEIGLQFNRARYYDPSSVAG